MFRCHVRYCIIVAEAGSCCGGILGKTTSVISAVVTHEVHMVE
jgi:hypothetical protein